MEDIKVWRLKGTVLGGFGPRWWKQRHLSGASPEIKKEFYKVLIHNKKENISYYVLSHIHFCTYLLYTLKIGLWNNFFVFVSIRNCTTIRQIYDDYRGVIIGMGVPKTTSKYSGGMILKTRLRQWCSNLHKNIVL